MAATLAIEPNRLRHVLGHYPTGVCVVTAMTPEGPAGLTVGSFTSVSLDPPLVAFLPDKRSSTWPKVRAAKRFCVNVLAEDQEYICRLFATSGTDRFSNVEWGLGPLGTPILLRASAWMACELDAVHEAGDHYIVLGRVHELDVASAELPLLFFRGGYGRFRPSAMVTGEADLIDHVRTADAARPMLESLAASVGVEAIASVQIDDLGVILASAGQPRTGVSTRVGRRLALVPPVGAPFMAWSGAATQAWLQRGRPQLTDDEAATYRAALARVRERGYAITLGSTGARVLAELLARKSTASTLDVAHSRAQGSTGVDPPELRPDERYDLATLSAPVFGHDGRVCMALTLLGFPGEISGAEIESYGATLLEACRGVAAAIA